MTDDLPELDLDAVWDAVGDRDWAKAEKILKDAGYDLEDLGALAMQCREDDEDLPEIDLSPEPGE